MSAPAPAIGGVVGARGSLYAPYVPTKVSASIPGVLEDCGLDKGIYARKIKCSENDKHPKFEWHGKSCGEPGCPRHWKQWAIRGADRIGCRLQGFYEIKRNKRYPPRHIVLSISDVDPLLEKLEKMEPSDQVRTLRKYFIERASAIGCTGGSLVLHLWRTNDLVPDGKGEKKWSWVRSKGYFWKHFVKFSPHAHIIGYGYLKKPEPGHFYYANIRVLKTRDDIEATAYYQLDHAAIIDGTKINAVVYFGNCGYRKLKMVARWKVPRDLRCNKCGAIMVYEDSGEAVITKRSMGDYEIVPDRPPPTQEILVF